MSKTSDNLMQPLISAGPVAATGAMTRHNQQQHQGQAGSIFQSSLAEVPLAVYTEALGREGQQLLRQALLPAVELLASVLLQQNMYFVLVGAK